jgi:hypothetical protein
MMRVDETETILVEQTTNDTDQQITLEAETTLLLELSTQLHCFDEGRAAASSIMEQLCRHENISTKNSTSNQSERIKK